MVPIFRGTVTPDGRLDLEADQARMVAWLRGLAGKEVDVIVRRHRRRRTLPQNRWLFGVAYPLIAEHLGYDRHEHLALHYDLLAEFGGREWDPTLQMWRARLRHSKNLSTVSFGEYMDWVVRWAADMDVVIPLPGESADE